MFEKIYIGGLKMEITNYLLNKADDATPFCKSIYLIRVLQMFSKVEFLNNLHHKQMSVLFIPLVLGS